MIYFDDSVTATNIPAGQKHAVYYVDGDTANGTEMLAHLGKDCKYMGITVFGRVGKGIQIVDCELGDVTVPGAVDWVAKSLAAGVYRPCVYADADTWTNGGLFAALEHYGVTIKRWVAAYPGTGENVPEGYDAHQYAGGVNVPVDKNIALDTFFDTRAPKAPKPKPAPEPKLTYHYEKFDDTVRDLFTGHTGSERGIVQEYDKKRPHPAINRDRLNRLRNDMGYLAARLNTLKANGEDMTKYDRTWRYDQLVARSNGVVVKPSAP